MDCPKIEKISNDITKNLDNYINQVCKMQYAHFYSLLLFYIQNKDFTTKDILKLINNEMERDADIKNYVYDFMKELK